MGSWLDPSRGKGLLCTPRSKLPLRDERASLGGHPPLTVRWGHGFLYSPICPLRSASSQEAKLSPEPFLRPTNSLLVTNQMQLKTIFLKI